MKALFWIGIFVAQAAFVAYGLALTFWTINEWLSEQPLNALFGGGMGGLMFFLAWKKGRDWARTYYFKYVRR